LWDLVLDHLYHISSTGCRSEKYFRWGDRRHLGIWGSRISGTLGVGAVSSNRNMLLQCPNMAFKPPGCHYFRFRLERGQSFRAKSCVPGYTGNVCRHGAASSWVHASWDGERSGVRRHKSITESRSISGFSVPCISDLVVFRLFCRRVSNVNRYNRWRYRKSDGTFNTETHDGESMCHQINDVT
jgi:hypothetical protein